MIYVYEYSYCKNVNIQCKALDMRTKIDYRFIAETRFTLHSNANDRAKVSYDVDMIWFGNSGIPTTFVNHVILEIIDDAIKDYIEQNRQSMIDAVMKEIKECKMNSPHLKFAVLPIVS